MSEDARKMIAKRFADRRIEDMVPPLDFGDMVALEDRISSGEISLSGLPADVRDDYEIQKAKIKVAGSRLAPLVEPVMKAATVFRRSLSEWPEVSEEDFDALKGTWEYYTGLLRRDPANWTLLEAHEKWMQRQHERALEELKSEDDDVIRGRLASHEVAYGLKLRTLRRLMHRYMVTNTLPTWEEEKEAIEEEAKRPYGLPPEIQKWIVDELNVEVKSGKKVADAGDAVSRRLEEEKGIKRTPSAVLSYYYR